MSDREFNFLRRVVKRHTGIALADYKRNMLYRRISKRMRALNMDEVKPYCELLSGPKAAGEIPLFINVVTTNKTSFFREAHHFDHLARIALPTFIDEAANRGSRRLRIWSAGCSSGEEPYSIAMILQDSLKGLGQWDAKILATDIDTNMVESGQQGLFPADAMKPVPAPLRGRYAAPNSGDKSQVRMATSIRSSIVFKPLNLLEAWPMNGPFDSIFCRNVVIYFDKPTQRILFDRYADIMRMGSVLYIGHSESLYGITERFRAVGQSIYQKIA
ncbi:MAG: protein-glutamate O-methyltransferase [Rhizobiales bacterium]|nr:protein-glutamate O-methyltransferase [Hyphomicrobiales bacterium]